MPQHSDDTTRDTAPRTVARPAPGARAGRPSPRVAATLAVALGLTATPALAYVGPGAGLGFVGTLFGIGAAVVLAMVGLLWYPLKRAFGKKTVVVDGAEAEIERQPEGDEDR